MQIRRRPLAPSCGFTADVHPILRRVYAARGLQSNADLDLSLDRLLPVGSLEGVDAAAQLLTAHRCAGRVLVIGDFDADGATSTALLVRSLRAMHFAHVDFLVPNRFRFGYGLTPEIVALAATRQPSLIVTVDNGVSSVAGVAAARELGVPVLVTDHHLPGAVLPRAEVIVNPNLANGRFASPALAGVGVAFYVVAALARTLVQDDFRAAELLDLVALGTVADVVPLDRNNRVLVAQGLRRIRAGRCVPGIRALLESAGRRFAQITAADLGFAVAPRLNAAGRLTDMSVGIACLLADDPSEAGRLAGLLAKLNEERREIEQRMQLEALDIAAGVRFSDDGEESLGLCLFDESWHQGVVGLVAGRIKDRLHRPVIAFARAADGSLRGSARSVAGVNIRDALDSIASCYRVRAQNPNELAAEPSEGVPAWLARDECVRMRGDTCHERAQGSNVEMMKKQRGNAQIEVLRMVFPRPFGDIRPQHRQLPPELTIAVSGFFAEQIVPVEYGQCDTGPP